MRSEGTAEALADSESAPQPACPAGGPGRQEWRLTDYTERLSAFSPPCTCRECFPDGTVDMAVVEHVVLSRSHPSACHRPASQHTECESTEVAADGGSTPDPFADCERVPVSTITDLQRADGVVWNGVTEPLTVHVPSTDPAGAVQLKGPNGGDYFLEVRPNGMGTVVYPGYGHVSNVRQVVPSETTAASVSD